MRRVHRFVGVLCVAGLLGGCAAGMQTTYADPQSTPKALNLYFNQKDLQILAESMVDDLVSTPILGADRPYVRVSEVVNKTSEHIDTKAITDSIRTRLIRSGKVRFVTDVGEESVARQVVKEQDAGQMSSRFDAESAPRIGKLKLAQYHLFGELVSMTSKAGRYKEQYYKFTLSLVNTETGVLEWANEKEILKQGKKSVVGW